MPLIVITGIPSSGKTTRGNELKEFLESRGKEVHLVSENEQIIKANFEKNQLYSDSSKEKHIRGLLKSEILKLMTPNNVVILDALNYIKGYRYELYCGSKANKNTQCTVHVEINRDEAWSFNENRSEETEKYNRSTFEALIMRYEEPDGKNRWDSPLFIVFPHENLNKEAIMDCLFNKAPAPPNMSTQNAPLNSTNFLYDLDQVTKKIVEGLIRSKNMGTGHRVKVEGFPDLSIDISNATVQQLMLSSRFLRFYCSNTATKITQNTRFLVPQNPVKPKIDPNKLPPKTKIDADTIALLERLSLVDCANRQGIETLEEAIAFADQIQQVDTTNVEPLVTVLEDRPLRVREDSVTEGNCREDILKNAAVTEEEYFVAPPGNIPLEARDNLLYDDVQQNSKSEIFKIESTGLLLQENLRVEWFNNIVINKDISVFPSANGFTETYNFAKATCLDTAPFAVAQFTEKKQSLEKRDENKINFLDYFENGTILECYVFVTPSSATHFFHQWQRDRRIWWRKFSASPGRYVLTDIKTDADDSQSVEILAKYSWGDQIIEKLTLGKPCRNVPQPQLQVTRSDCNAKSRNVIS
ncbi:KTI12 -like protein [Asbolus verrucosus]|uniref:Glutamyl-tRNA(Gln) amidotransferase subunit C, mitochondrial n=1 Tax=Asbolus verrucosus TaxID=1661398 RepID=A0A482W7P6_ASBVE|nr:KTI12 -like protein [Asbolus verrucosus]